MRIRLLFALIVIALLSAPVLVLAQSTLPQTKSAQIMQMSTCFPTQFAGAITPAILVTCLTGIINSYQQYTSVNAQTGTTYAVQTSDYGKLVTFSNSGSVAVSIPTATSSFLPFNVYVLNLGAGTVTIAPTTGTIGGSATLVLATNQGGWLIADGTGSNYDNFGAYGVVGPSSSTNGDVALFSGTSGKLIVDGGGKVVLISPGQYYIATSGNGGSDSNNCLAATVSGGNGPCLTLAHTATVAFSYDNNGSGPQINVGAGTFQGTSLSGNPRGTAGGGISGQHMIISGAGHASTTFTDTNGNNWVFDFSNKMDVQLKSMTISMPSGDDGVFAQNPGTYFSIGTDLVFTGTSGSEAAIHVEAYALAESPGTNTVTFGGTMAYPFSIGQNGYVEFDGGGTGSLVCSTLAMTDYVFMNGNATFHLGSGWSFSGCGAVTGTPYLVEGQSYLVNDSGNSLPGNVNGIVELGGRYNPPPPPTLTSNTGLGSGGTVTNIAGGSHGGILKLTAGSTASSSGNVVLAPAETNESINSGNPVPCVAGLLNGTGSWATASTVLVLGNTTSALTFQWNNNGNNLTNTDTYFIQWVCNGD